MRMTPLDIQTHRFRKRLSGCDPTEVESFLRMIAEDYESLLQENESLRDVVRRLETRVDDLSANEHVLQETLVSAQAMSDDLRKAALKEAEVTLSEAEVRAEKILDAAHRRAAQLSDDIREMRGLRVRLATVLRAAMDNHLRLIEGLEDGSEEDPMLDGKVTYLTRPLPAPSEHDPHSETGGGS